MAATDDLRAEMEKQISDLKKEVAKLSRSISAKASEALGDAENVAEDLKDRAAGAARQARRQAQVVSEAARENPVTTATILSSAGLLGFVAGLLVGGLLANNSRNSGWHW